MHRGRFEPEGTTVSRENSFPSNSENLHKNHNHKNHCNIKKGFITKKYVKKNNLKSARLTCGDRVGVLHL